MTLSTKMVRLTLNAHKYGRISVEPPHHIFIQSFNLWYINFLRYVNVTCLFNLTHMEDIIIVLNILTIGTTECKKYIFKPCPWHGIIKSPGHTFKHINLPCWRPVHLVENDNTETVIEPTTKPPNKFSISHWMYEKLIGFGNDYLI